jgi:D-alanyl-D-alanine carboxypeptidase/D-alanyl-D-alanine-endopeptidase (penicillin-binding protein 4)
MMERTDFQDYFLALPILGVDGSLAGSATPGSKAIGHVYAKTGTTVDENPLSGGGVALAKALAGYVDTASGKRLVFAIYVNNVPVGSVDDIMTLGSDVAHISELIYASF